jgi:tetratricopeptide (TPR) repeat protein
MTPSLAAAQKTVEKSPKRARWVAWSVVALVVALSGIVIATRSRNRPTVDQVERGSGATAGAVISNRPPASASADSRVASLIAEGNEQVSRDNVQAAIAAYSRGLDINPQSEDLHYNLGIAYARAENTAKAEFHYKEALRILPDYPEAHYNFGNLLLRLGRLEEAESHFTEATKILPEYALAYNGLGILRQRQNKADEAQSLFEKAIRCKSNYWQARFNLANSYLAQGKTEQATAELQETLRLNPSFEAAQRELDKLQSRLGPLPSQ